MARDRLVNLALVAGVCCGFGSMSWRAITRGWSCEYAGRWGDGDRPQ